MVMAAHVCRSSVLSSRGIGWLEGPVTMSVVERLCVENEMIGSESSTVVGNHPVHYDKLFPANKIHNDDNQVINNLLQLFLLDLGVSLCLCC